MKDLTKIEDDEVLRLLPKKKKGFLSIAFSRFGAILLIFLIEIAILYVLYKWFYDYVSIFAGIQTVFSFGMIFYLFNSKMDSSAKLTWLYIIMLLPVPGTILLCFSQNDIGHRMVKKVVKALIEESQGVINQEEEVIVNPELVESGTDDLCRYLNNSGHFPIYSNTKVTYCALGEDKFNYLIDAIYKAESFIYLEYFIIDEGFMWGSVLKILADKAKAGVDVRVMYDGMCEAALLPHNYPKRMEKLGIKCKAFNSIKPFISSQYNYRDHRKIAIIDGKIAFNGGINLADEYMNKVSYFGHWKDCSVMLEGAAVESFTLMFLQMWNIDEKVHDWSPAKINHNVNDSSGFVMPYADSPLDNFRVGENVYLDILYKASSYVHIMTPYLIIDNEMETALTYAAQRGIDVKIIMPGIPDKKLAYALAKNHYRTLVEAGVKIYEYEPGFVHAKVFVSDDIKAVVGTINLDYRSLYHHFECATYMYKTDCIQDIERDYENTLEKCRHITMENVKKEKLFYKIAGTLLKPFETLM